MIRRSVRRSIAPSALALLVGLTAPALADSAYYTGADAAGNAVVLRVDQGRVVEVRAASPVAKLADAEAPFVRGDFDGCQVAADGAFQCFRSTLCKIGEPGIPSVSGRLSSDGQRVSGTIGGCFASQRFTAERTKTFGRTERATAAPVVDATLACTGDSDTLCLNNSRFSAEITWRTPNGQTGRGQVQSIPQQDSGLFWFFNVDNLEMLVKVLNGCGVNNRYWVFFSAGTNVNFDLTVRDTARNITRTYSNPQGTLAAPIADTSAFATCP